MRFKVVLDPSEAGVAVCSPSLPGCWSQGATVDEALAHTAEAIRGNLTVKIELADGAEIGEVEVAI